MTERKFTPGPWHWDYGIYDPYALIAPNERYPARDIIRARDGVVYSEITSDPANIEISTPANSHLIAAAPEIYEALEAIIARWDTPLWKDAEPTGKVIAVGRAALAKARGE